MVEAINKLVRKTFSSRSLVENLQMKKYRVYGHGVDKVNEIRKNCQEPSCETQLEEEIDSHLGDFIERWKQLLLLMKQLIFNAKRTVKSSFKVLCQIEKKSLEPRFGLNDSTHEHWKKLERIWSYKRKE